MAVMHETSRVDAFPVSGYEILRTLTEGGMSRVYIARQFTLNRLVCVKVMSIPPGVDADACRSRFCREAELLASVSHPHVLSIFDFGATADQGLPYLVTEYIEGGDLRGRMKTGEAMPVSQARSILLQIGDALSHLHSKGILHRDLKPENILMPTDSLAKVGDFGIAVMRDKAGVLTESFFGLGTVGYVSPEQQYGLKVDERTDQYSLAALCYELLTGRRPLGSFPPPTQLNVQLPIKLDAVILRGLAEEPKNRFGSVREFLGACDDALSERSARRPRSRFKLLAWLLVFVVLTAGTRAFVRFRQRQHRAVVNAGANVPIPPPLTSKASALIHSPESKQAEPKTPGRSPEFLRLVELRAYSIWVKEGRPTGLAGESVKDKNWKEAEKQIEDEVKSRAFHIWEKQGRPTGPAGDAVREKNMHSAEEEQLKETEEELLRHPLD